MADGSGYRYSLTDPRADPGRYMYPPPESDLLESHEAARRECVERLTPLAGGRPTPVARTPAPPRVAPLAPGSGEARTLDVLEACLSAGPDDPSAAAWVDMLTRKFETVRVLRASYGADLKPIDRTELGLDAYAFLAELVARRASADNGALSTLLKINDVIDAATRTAPAPQTAAAPAPAPSPSPSLAQDELSQGAAASAALRAIDAELAAVAALRTAPPTAANLPPIPAESDTHGPGVLFGVGLLAADTGRARAYVDVLVAAGLTPARAVVVDVPSVTAAPSAPAQTPLFDNVTPLRQALARAGIPAVHVVADRLDDPAVVSAAAGLPPIVVIAGPAGAILGRAFFEIAGKRYLHVHPGRLPDYRGSTPMYYQLLAEGRLTATALFIEEQIDTGPVVAELDFAPPEDRSTIDLAYDPWMRAVLLRDVLARIAAGIGIAGESQRSGGRTYFVIHPVLRRIATDSARSIDA